MSWKEVNPMQQKILFIADYLRQISSMTDLCSRYGISRKTGYKWVLRFDHLGLDGLSEQSRRPLKSPIETPYRLQQKIIELRQKYTTAPGAKKLEVLLSQCYPNEHIPSKTTIYKILNRAGLIDARKPRRRVSLYPQPFSPVQEVNECWSVDYKGQFKLGNGHWCYPLTVMDHKSRFLFCCQGLKGPVYKETRASSSIYFDATVYRYEFVQITVRPLPAFQEEGFQNFLSGGLSSISGQNALNRVSPSRMVAMNGCTER